MNDLHYKISCDEELYFGTIPAGEAPFIRALAQCFGDPNGDPIASLLSWNGGEEENLQELATHNEPDDRQDFYTGDFKFMITVSTTPIGPKIEPADQWWKSLTDAARLTIYEDAMRGK